MDIAVVRLRYLVIDQMGKLPCKNVGQGEDCYIEIFKVKVKGTEAHEKLCFE